VDCGEKHFQFSATTVLGSDTAVMGCVDDTDNDTHGGAGGREMLTDPPGTIGCHGRGFPPVWASLRNQLRLLRSI